VATISSFGKDSFDNADSSFQGLGNLISTAVLGVIPGCTDNAAFNYNPNATVDDGSCVPVVIGCMDLAASNYDCDCTVTGPLFPAGGCGDGVNTDGNCCVINGCTNSLYVEYDPNATNNDGSCSTLITYGCTNVTTITIGDNNTGNLSYPQYWNGATIAGQQPCDGSQIGAADDCVNDANGNLQSGPNCCCEETVVGCTDASAQNYVANANYQPHPGSDLECIPNVFGCTNPVADNYDAGATIDDGSCTYTVSVPGCTNPIACNYDVNATIDDGSCVLPDGCTDPLYLEYDVNALCDDGSCSVLIVNGCTDPLYLEYDATATVDDGSCATLIVNGCTDPLYLEYDSLANQDDGSCSTLIVPGCTDPLACNYNATANQDDGSCLNNFGCTDILYIEYDASADCDDGSCATLIVLGCTDVNADNYDAAANVDDGSCAYLGCTDPLALNYDANATVNDGSCSYAPQCTDTNGDTYTIGDSHPTLDATLFQFSYDQPGFMQEGDCGRMYVTNTSINGNTNWGSTPGCYNTNVPSSGFTGDLWSISVQFNGYRNTQDMIAHGCGGTGTVIEWLSTLDDPNYHIPSLQEGWDIYNNVGPGDVYGLGNLTPLVSPNRLWISEEAHPPDSATHAKLVDWFNGGLVKYPKVAVGTGQYGLGVLYQGNFGCIDDTAGIYPDVNGNGSDGLPCTAPCANGYLASNYDPAASFGDGSCAFSLQLGDYHEGGYIVKFNNGYDETGGGIVASNYSEAYSFTTDQWSSSTNDIGTSIDNGAQNTLDIIASDGAASAANLTILPHNGYSDWYLPSFSELQLISDGTGSLYSGLNTNNLYYWSSTELASDPANKAYKWKAEFNWGTSDNKDEFFGVMFFRAF